MKSFYIVIIIALLTHTQLIAQPTCSSLRNSISYTYWPESSESFITIIEGNKLTDIVGNLHDTVIYRIDWVDSCTFSMQYLSGGNKLPKKILDFNKDHIFYNKIDKITDEYVVSRMFQDKPKGRMLKRDTSWFSPKVALAKSSSFEKISGPLFDKKTSRSDSADYALVYVYRPNKFWLLLSSYPFYFDDEVMSMIENNSGYVFKVKKEGIHQFTSRLFQDNDSVSVDIRFGQKYFIKPWIEWGLKKRGYNFKLHVEHIADQATGAAEFDNVKMK
jgi:hypothetical protein